MKIPISSSPEKFFIQLIRILSSFAPLKDLAPKEKAVLSEILFQHYLNRGIKENVRSIVVFSKSSRENMQNRLNMSEDSFNVHLSGLRKANILSKDNNLPKFLRILPKDTFEFTILFKLTNAETS